MEPRRAKYPDLGCRGRERDWKNGIEGGRDFDSIPSGAGFVNIFEQPVMVCWCGCSKILLEALWEHAHVNEGHVEVHGETWLVNLAPLKDFLDSITE